MASLIRHNVTAASLEHNDVTAASLERNDVTLLRQTIGQTLWQYFDIGKGLSSCQFFLSKNLRLFIDLQLELVPLAPNVTGLLLVLALRVSLATNKAGNFVSSN